MCPLVGFLFVYIYHTLYVVVAAVADADAILIKGTIHLLLGVRSFARCSNILLVRNEIGMHRSIQNRHHYTINLIQEIDI